MSEYGLEMPVWITEFGAGMAEPFPFPIPEIPEIVFGDKTIVYPYAKLLGKSFLFVSKLSSQETHNITPSNI